VRKWRENEEIEKANEFNILFRREMIEAESESSYQCLCVISMKLSAKEMKMKAINQCRNIS
jgi:hypothetical protein